MSIKNQKNEQSKSLISVKNSDDQRMSNKLYADIIHGSREFFNTLNASEKATALKILEELKENSGESLTYDYLWELNYNEKPVSITEFMENEYYGGWLLPEMFPKWRDVVKDVFAPGSPYMEVILCLAGDTKVLLFNGIVKTLKELYDQYYKDGFWVYSFDKIEKKIVPGYCDRVMKYGRDRLIRVQLANGFTFRANCDHEMVLSDGNKKMVKDFRVGDILCTYEFGVENPQDDYGCRVMNIEKDGIEPVYCLMVKQWHNFAIVDDSGRKGVFSGNSGAIGTGKCVDKCSVINTRKGFCEIGKLVESKYQGKVLAESGLQDVVDLHDEGDTETRKMITKHGHELEGRPNHKIRVMKNLQLEWKELKDLEQGDCVVEMSSKIFGNYELSDNVAELIGWFIAEGHGRHTDRTLSLHPSEVSYVASLARDAAKFFKGKTRLYLKHSDVILNGGRTLEYLVEGVSATREIPDCILKAPRRAIAKFFKGLFSGDGWADDCVVSFCSVSKKLAQQSQVILTSMGYQCSVTHKVCGYTKNGVRKDTGIAYAVSIVGVESKRKFVNEIGFWHDYKQKNAIGQTHDSTNADHSFAFKLSNDEFIKFRDMQPKFNSGNIINGMDKTTSPRGIIRRLKKQGCTVSLLRKIKEAGGVLHEVFEKFVSGELLFDTVDTVEKSNAHCYDLTVKGDPSYISNGFISHNTSVAAFMLEYLIYKMSCLKNPAKYYGLIKDSKIIFGIYSVTQTQAAGVGYGTLRGYVENTPYFQHRFPFDHRTKRKIVFYNSSIEVVAGCVAEGTKIMTQNGEVPIEKLTEITNTVITSDCDKVFSSEYKGVKYSGVKKCLNVVVATGNNVVCSYDHKFRVEDSDGKLMWVKASALKKGDVVFVLSNVQQSKVNEKLKNISKDVVQRAGNICEDCEIYRTRIESITEVGLKKTYDVIEVSGTHSVFTGKILTSNSRELHVLGNNLFVLYLDEVNFMEDKVTNPNKNVDINVELGQAGEIYNAAKSRIKSRFMRPGGSYPGMVFLLSSKTSVNSFLEKHVKKIKNDITEKRTLLLDYARWDTQPAERFILPKFRVQVGNAVFPSKILDDNEASAPNTTIIDNVPGEFREDFLASPERALREIAGVSTVGISPLFRDKTPIYNCIDNTMQHPFTKETITISVISEIELTDYLKTDVLFNVINGAYVPKINPKAGRVVHLDLSLKKDATGIAMGHISGMKKVKKMRLDGTYFMDNEPEIIIDFMLRIVSSSGSQVDYGKIRTLIQSLSDYGYQIVMVTADQYQSADTLNIFQKIGWKTKYVSLDRTPEPYLYFKQSCVDGRLKYYEYAPFIKEVSELEFDYDKKKVDHPTDGAKDVADAVAAVVFTLMTDKETLSTNTPMISSFLTVGVYDEGKEYVPASKVDSYAGNNPGSIVIKGEMNVNVNALADEVIRQLNIRNSSSLPLNDKEK